MSSNFLSMACNRHLGQTLSSAPVTWCLQPPSPSCYHAMLLAGSGKQESHTRQVSLSQSHTQKCSCKAAMQGQPAHLRRRSVSSLSFFSRSASDSGLLPAPGAVSTAAAGVAMAKDGRVLVVLQPLFSPPSGS